VDGTIDEVVLVGNRSGYGLSFYLGCEVEQVAMDDEEAKVDLPDPIQSLRDELAEIEGRRVFLVPVRRAEEFEDVMGSLATPVRHRGSLHELRFYTPVADG
jgi:hypothetical protein